MRPLATDLMVWQHIKTKYAIAVSILPIGLMFAAFAPVWLIAEAIAEALGIPPDAAVKDHPNGMVWFISFLVLMVLMMIGGYVLGYVLDAIILRFVFSWPQGRVRGLLLHSTIPTHWKKSSTSTPATSPGFNATAWSKTRKRGKARFILRNGALGWGIPMFVLMAGGPGFFGVPYRAEASVLCWLWQGALWVGAGALFGLVIWSIAEKQFNSQSDDKKH